MLKTQRIEEMRKYVEKHHVVSLEQLAEVFQVSLNTVRRDTNSLVTTGKMKKVHGGISLVNSQPVNYQVRQVINEKSKKVIAQKAASLVENGDIIYVDTGTTTVYLAEYLQEKEVTVITNNLDFIVQSQLYPNLRIISTGGLLDSTLNAFVHLQNMDVLRSYNITKAFVASTGISIENGITHASPLEYEVKKYIVSKSKETYLLADYSKFGKQALITFSQLDELDFIITDQTPANTYLDFISQHKVELIVVDNLNY
ncbi:DeoR/GlpR family DNA-binding transcription regulator [Salipaludibacillus sp. CF4.18]|uniref:DeoR/GlpR family DNA-binding transcription regulator n=1 Tax=Salipaludibacillus sp. CF4.18 TaxID=3373081 RepID=UPI003EE4A8F3